MSKGTFRPSLISLFLAAGLMVTSAPARAALTEGLIAHWPLNEITANTTPDAAGPNVLTVVGNPTVESGMEGNAIRFNGTNSYLVTRHDSVRAEGSLPVYPAGSYSISMWVKGPAQTARYLFSEGSTNSNTPLFILQTGQAAANNGKFDVIIRTDANTTPLNHVVSDTVVFDDTWHHVTWVDDFGTVRLYVDAVPDIANFNYTPGAISVNTTALANLVRAAVNTNATFNGLIDEVKLWERALSEDEVFELVPDIAPVLKTGPTNVTRRTGDWALFSVTHTGTGPFTYQWFRNGVPIDNSNSRNYQATDLVTGDAYTVKVTNAAGSFTTDPATVTVVPDPVPDVRNALNNYWPLNTIESVDGVLRSKDLYSGNDMVLIGFADANDVVTGQFGNALVFNGDTNRFTYRTNGAPIYSSTNYSVSMWVKGAFSGQNDRRVFAEGSTTDNDPLFTIGTDAAGTSASATVFVRNDTAVNAAVVGKKTTRPVFDDAWHHLVWTDGNGQARLYVDGVLDETDFNYARPALTLNTSSLGAILRAAVSNPLFGSVDEVATWKRVLTWTEIQSIMTNGVPAPISIIAPGIITQPLDRSSGVFAGDTVTFSVQTSGTVPLTYEWYRGATKIDTNLNASAATDTLTLTNVTVGDSGSTFYVKVTNPAGSVQSDTVGLNVSSFTPATSGQVLNVDIDLTGSPNLQAGFDEFNLGINATNYNGVGLTISGLGAALADRNRTTGATVPNNPPIMTQAQIYNDFIFANSLTDGAGLRILIERLAPNTKYGVTIWSFDPQSTAARFADWSETSNPEAPQIIQAGYSFDGAVQPTHDFDNTLGAILTSSAAGKLQIDAVKNGGANFGAFVNAIRLVANPTVQIIKSEVASGNLRITVETQFPGQAVTIEEKSDIASATWTASAPVFTETHGPIVTFDLPMTESKMFYRAVVTP